MARRTTQAWTTVPHFVQMVDVDLTAAAQVRAVSGATWTDLVVAALAAALATVPRANIAYADGELFEFEDVDIGIAVDTPAGLVVPVVRHASRLTLADLRAAIAEVVDRALTGASRVTDTGRASATVSNLGSAGIRAGVPVLNPPEAMLVFVGDAAPRAVVHDGSVVSRLTCTLSIAYDHRAFAGASAAAVTNAVRAWLEAPPPL
jgi:pyruvate dehydrogenase E2 component (dihydrolipoamide acetyltransferase)